MKKEHNDPVACELRITEPTKIFHKVTEAFYQEDAPMCKRCLKRKAYPGYESGLCAGCGGSQSDYNSYRKYINKEKPKYGSIEDLKKELT